MERLSYFLHNPQISAERFYEPMVYYVLQAFAGESVLLTLDTSMLWDQFCLIEVCFVWGGRSFTLAQGVLEHGSAMVGFEQYHPLLERAKRLLPPEVQVTLLADRGFEHAALVRWLRQHQWSWAIRVKSDLAVRLANGQTRSVEQLTPPLEQAYLYPNVQVFSEVAAHLAIAQLIDAKDAWAVLSDHPPSLQTFALYGQRFGGIVREASPEEKPHFKDYKSAAFEVLHSGLRDAQALTCLLMLLVRLRRSEALCATLMALMLGMMLVQARQRAAIDWHGDRGLSFLQLGLRQVAGLCYQRLPLPSLLPLPKSNPPPACASQKKRTVLDCRIEFSKVVSFSY
jgi:hypothetical protein